MSQIKSRLLALETHLQTIVEGTFARLFRQDGLQDDLAFKLADAMQRGVKVQADGQLVAPNLFTLLVPPDLYQEFSNEEEMLDNLGRAIAQAGNQAGFSFLNPPEIEVSVDDGLHPREYRIIAHIHLDHLTGTNNLDQDIDTESATIPANSYLIVNGTDIFPLTTSVVNIGRRPDNHLVIPDGRVSRLHSQLRVIKGRFMIFDLGSTGGTLVNGKSVSQCTLFPGDVISLAGVPLIFGQESTDIGETQQYIPGDDDPTQI